MTPELLQAALDESLRFGPAARLVFTFPGNEDALELHPLAYNRVGPSGFRVDIRILEGDDADLVDNVIFLDAEAVESIELQVKQAGSVWKNEPYSELGDDEP